MPIYFNTALNFNSPYELCQLIELDRRAWYRLYTTIKMKNVLCLADSPFPSDVMLMPSPSQVSFITPLAPFIAQLFPNVRVVQSDVDNIVLSYPNPHLQQQFVKTWEESPINYTYQRIDTCQMNKALLARTTEPIPRSGWDLIICRKGMCDCIGEMYHKICCGVSNTVPALQNFLTKISFALTERPNAIAILHGNDTPHIVHRWTHVIEKWNLMQQGNPRNHAANLVIEEKKSEYQNFFILMRKQKSDVDILHHARDTLRKPHISHCSRIV